MSTGSLKFASLLIVITAGGGVAWKAQQGIQHPAEAVSQDDGEDPAEDPFDDDFGREPTELPERTKPSAPKVGAVNWVEEEQEEQTDEQRPPHRPSALPDKFQRSSPPAKSQSKSLGSPIRARVAVEPPVEETDDEPTELADQRDSADTTDDPFETSSAKPSRRASLTPVPDTDADDDANEEVAGHAKMEDDDRDGSDPFDNSQPVLLIGNEESPKARRKSPPVLDDEPKPIAEETKPTEIEDSNDDPFDSAMPLDSSGSDRLSLDRNERNNLVPDKKTKPRHESDDEPENDSVGPSFSTPPDEIEEAPPKRTPRRTPPPKDDDVEDAFANEPADEPVPKRRGPPAKVKEDDDDMFGGEPLSDKPEPVKGMPTITPGEVRQDEPRTREHIIQPAPKRTPRKPAAPKDDVDDAFGSEPASEEPRTPRRKPAKAESDDDAFGSKLIPSAQPVPDLGKPSTRPIDIPTDEPSVIESEPRSSKSRRSPKQIEEPSDEPSVIESAPRTSKSRRSQKSEEPAAEKSPRLLPVPVPETEDSRPSLPTDLDANEPAESDDALSRPARNQSKLDELTGDGTPDHAAPKGLQQPRLTIEKIAPKQAVLGQPLIYSVVVKNAGSADAHQVTVEDRIPKGTKLEGTSPRAELIDKRLVWKLGTLKPDEQKKISIKVTPQEQGPIGSVAKVNFVAEIAAEIEITAPQVLLSIEAPTQVRLGDKLHIVYKVRNSGKADAENITVRNIIPEGLRHPAGADLEYVIGTLPAQESREIKLDLIATKNGKVANKTVITGDGGIKVEEETPVEVVGEQLLLTRTGKNRLYIDKPAVFTSTVANEGTAPANKVMVAEVIPAGLEFVSASDNGKFDPATRAVTWSIGPIGPGEEMQLSTKLMPKKQGDYRATVTVTGPAGSVATVDAQMKVDGFAAVAVESKTDTRLISIGEKATIRLSCKNQGTAATKNLILSAQLPPELKLVDGQGQTGWAQDGNVITFEAIPSLNPNETATFEIQVEGKKDGDTRIELQISADHLTRPLHRDETIRVAPDSE